MITVIKILIIWFISYRLARFIWNVIFRLGGYTEDEVYNRWDKETLHHQEMQASYSLIFCFGPLALIIGIFILLVSILTKYEIAISEIIIACTKLKCGTQVNDSLTAARKEEN